VLGGGGLEFLLPLQKFLPAMEEHKDTTREILRRDIMTEVNGIFLGEGAITSSSRSPKDFLHDEERLAAVGS
jgi:hypothetical protein